MPSVREQPTTGFCRLKMIPPQALALAHYKARVSSRSGNRVGPATVHYLRTYLETTPGQPNWGG
jgi:hypothetical protein